MGLNKLFLYKKKLLNYSIAYKLLITLCTVLTVFANPAYATPDISVLAQGSPVKINNTLVQKIIVNFKADSSWSLSVLSFDEALKNLSQPNQQIPVNNVFMTDNLLSSNTYYFEPNKTIQIDSGGNTGTFNKMYTLRITSPDSAYPGIYTGTFKFTLTSGTDVATYIYTLSFEQPKIQKIDITPDSMFIKVLPYDAMKKNYNFSTSSPTKVLIRSNTGWKLMLKNEAENNSLNCKFKVTALSGNTKINYGLDYTDLPVNNLIIAEGGPTVGSDGKTLDTEIIQIKYLFKTTENDIQSSDTYSFDVKYDLISD